MSITNRIRMLLLAAWLGIAIYFGAVVAPSTFRVLIAAEVANEQRLKKYSPDDPIFFDGRELAGAIVSRTLAAVNKSGLVLSLLLLLTSLAVRKCYGRASFILQSVLLTIVAIATAAGEWVIAAKMRGLRAVMQGHIDQVPLDDPNRMAFAALHGYSVAALGIAMIAALIVILLMVVSRERVVTNSTE